MKSIYFVLLAAALVLGGCSGAGGDETAPDQDVEASNASELSTRGIILRNGAVRTLDNGPDTLKVTASAGSAKAKVIDSSLATCTVTVDHGASTTKKTVFKIDIEYEVDDGWNGCTIDFSAPGYKSTLEVGLNVDD